MEKLMKPAEYAQEIGISRQAVYAKIKRGILTTKSVEGKLYIVVDTLPQKTVSQETEQKPTLQTGTEEKTVPTPKPHPFKSDKDIKDYKALLQAKDETISVLKSTVKDLKKSNKQISTTLRGEIDLLKDAFYEMRRLYAHQLEHKKTHDSIEVVLEEESTDGHEVKWISVKKFLKQKNIYTQKEDDALIKLCKKAYKSGDNRFKKIEGKLKLNAHKNYEDILI